MWFDARAALAEIQRREARRANQHTAIAAPSETLSGVANVAGVAAPVPLKAVIRPSDEQGAEPAILAAIRAGNRTPGSIATATRLGATAVYQALARMQVAGHVARARDGTLSAQGETND